MSAGRERWTRAMDKLWSPSSRCSWFVAAGWRGLRLPSDPGDTRPGSCSGSASGLAVRVAVRDGAMPSSA